MPTKACVDRVLIVGGGIAGLTTAAALAARRTDCLVVEIAAETLGSAIMISDRALDALDELGIGDQLRENGCLNALNPLGTPVTYGAPRKSLGLYRPVLSDFLRRRAEALGARVRTCVGLKSLNQDSNGVEVTLTDGSMDRYDLVIGADGIRSTTRALAFDDDIRPQYAGQSNVRWMAPGPPLDLPGGVFSAPFGKMLSYPLPKQKMIYAATVFVAQAGARPTQQQARDLLRQQLAAMDEPYTNALLARLTDDQSVLYRPFEWLLVPSPWYRGRVALIGDAAHATTAHMSSGGGMAIEDAVALSEELHAHANLVAALDAFMRRRLQRVCTVVDTSLTLSRMEAQGADGNAMFAAAAPAYETLQANF